MRIHFGCYCSLAETDFAAAETDFAAAENPD